MKLELPPEELRLLVEPALAQVLRESGVAAAIVAAADAALALRGLLDKAQAMRFLGIASERTLETWMRPAGVNGGRGLPHFKIGEAVRFKLTALEAWTDTFAVNPVLQRVA